VSIEGHPASATPPLLDDVLLEVLLDVLDEVLDDVLLEVLDDVLLDVLDDVLPENALEVCSALDPMPDVTDEVAPPLAELPPVLLPGFPDVTPPEDDDDVDDDVEELDDEEDDEDTSPDEDDDGLLPKQPAPLQARSTAAFPMRKHPPSGRVTRERTKAFQGRLSIPAT
jgi:hypothetical protein